MHVLEDAEAVDKDQWPTMPALPTQKPASAVVEMLRVLLKHIAEDSNIAPRMIANSDDLDLIALGQIEGVKAMTGWRYDLFGKYAHAMKDGKIGLSIAGDTLKLTDLA